MDNNIQKLETLLFTHGQSISKKKLAGILKCSNEEIDQYAKRLMEIRSSGGVIVIDSGSHLTLATNPELADFVLNQEKKEQTGELSKVAQETLAIIAYASPISKVDIDYIRGVNVQYTIRRLTLRGLIYEKKEGRGKFLTCTPELLMHLGVTKLEDLPQYEEIHNQIKEGVKITKRRMNNQNETDE